MAPSIRPNWNVLLTPCPGIACTASITAASNGVRQSPHHSTTARASRIFLPLISITGVRIPFTSRPLWMIASPPP